MKNLLKAMLVTIPMAFLLILGIDTIGAEETLKYYSWVVSFFIGAYFSERKS